MMHVLLESGGRARVEQSSGWTLASVLAHAAIVTMAVTLTTRAVPADADDPGTATDLVYAVPVIPAPREALPSGAPVGQFPIPVVDVPVDLPAMPRIRTFDPTQPYVGHALPSGAGRADGSSLSAYIPGMPSDGVHRHDAVDRIVAALPGNSSPDYPAALRSAGLAGEVTVQFVVDTMGRVEASSIAILRATHPQFADAVRRWLPRTRYAPAELGGRRVRQLVQQQVGFTLTR